MDPALDRGKPPPLRVVCQDPLGLLGGLKGKEPVPCH